MELGKVIHGSQPLQNNDHNKNMTIAMGRSRLKSMENDLNLHKEPVINQDKVKTVVSTLNRIMEPLHTDLKFQYHEKLNEYYVTVVNPITLEVIKEIPPKELLDKYAEMAELMGFLIDKKI